MSTALLTGASSGIGLSMARQLAKQGWHLILVARRTDRLTQLKAELEAAHHISVHLIPQDLSAPDAAQQLFEAARPWQVDALINNAGSGMQGRFLDMDPAALDQMLRLNVHSLTHLTRLFAREMQGRDGYILNVASAAAFLPSPWVSSYAATKAYVRSFSEALRYELRSTGVSVTTLYPRHHPHRIQRGRPREDAAPHGHVHPRRRHRRPDRPRRDVRPAPRGDPRLDQLDQRPAQPLAPAGSHHLERRPPVGQANGWER